MLKERFEKETQTEKEKKLQEMRVILTPQVFDPLWRFFEFHKHNVNEKVMSKVYMTEQSIRANLKKYFGHKSALLEARLYYILSDGLPNRRIYMETFIEKFYKPMFEEPPVIKAQFMFKMLDFDEDGYLHASDLVKAQDFCDELSEFGEEIAKLANYYIKVYLESRGKIKISDKINLHRYKDLLDAKYMEQERKGQHV